MSLRFLILYNPTSGRGRPALVEDVSRRLEQGGHQVTLEATRGPGDASSRLIQHEDTFDVIVAAGGDGTVSEVINGLVGKEHRTLGVIPTGTTNVLAKELELPTDAAAVAQTLLGGHTVPIYPNRLNDRRFLLWVGAGFDAWVVSGVDLALKKRIGKLAYAVAAMKRWPGYGRTSYRVDIDDRSYQAYSAIVTSGRFYAGRFRLAEPADLSRPHLGVVLFHSKSRLALMRNLFDLARGKIADSPGIETITGRTIHVEVETQANNDRTNQALQGTAGQLAEVVQVDGDPGIELPVDIEVVDLPIQVLVP